MAGFFAHLLLQKRGPRRYLGNRTKRILLPFVLFWPILYVIISTLWFWGGKTAGRLPAVGYAESDAAYTPLEIGAYLATQPRLWFEHFSLLHLWFLYYLVLFYAATGLLLSGARLLPTASERVMGCLDRLFRNAVQSRWRVLFLSLLLLPGMLLMRIWSVDTPNDSAVPELGSTVYYGTLFSLGWMLHRAPELLQSLTRHWPQHLLGATVILVLSFFPVEIAEAFGGQRAWFGRPGVHSFYQAIYGVGTALYIMGFMGMFQKLANRPTPFWRYVADSSYWIYLVHLPLIVAWQIAVYPLAWPSALKYLGGCLVVVPILFLSYRICVRSTWLGRLLNGRRYPFQWAWIPSPEPVTRKAMP
ncbi:MAG: acyltransferase 3 [Puniceicoccaceae bacterium 5H]|nr:MAG: acyltransferase 3 [Puniceicoccaceae bacterium 5H]